MEEIFPRGRVDGGSTYFPQQNRFCGLRSSSNQASRQILEDRATIATDQALNRATCTITSSHGLIATATSSMPTDNITSSLVSPFSEGAGSSSHSPSRPSSKRPLSMVSPDETVLSSPSHFFSVSHPQTMSLVPPSTRGTGKHTQLSAAQAQEEENQSQLIKINSITNTIHCLQNTLSTGFQELHTIIGRATAALYTISGWANMPKVTAVAEYFASNVNHASAFLSLKEDDCPGYAKMLYK